VLLAPGVRVVAEHVIFCGAKVAPDSEDDHKAEVREDGQLPALLAANATGHVFGRMKILFAEIFQKN
jgi:hypothetical protein